MAAVAFKTTVLDESGNPWQPTQAQVLRMFGDAYKGASFTRRAGALWRSWERSADAEFLPEQSTLRARSRHQYRNNPLAKGGIDTLTTWVVGDGLQCRPRLNRAVFLETLGWDTEQVKRAQALLLRSWLRFAENRECDLERQSPDIYGLQTLAFRSQLMSGDILTLLPMISRAPGAYETKIQLVEADRISNPGNKIDTPTLKGGVQLDNHGAPYSYWVQEFHPGDTYRSPWRQILAFGRASGRVNAWLEFERLRPGQTRGIPYLANALEPMAQLERYQDQELMAAIVGGSLTVLLKTTGAQGLAPTMGVQPIGALTPAQTQAAMQNYGLDYGAFVQLQPGEDAEIVDPKRPNTAFGDFIKSNVISLFAGLGLSAEVALKNFDKSFTASRAEINEVWKYVKVRRWQFSHSWCAPIYEAVITEDVVKGRLSLPGFLDDVAMRNAYLSALWLGPTPGTLNPVAEVEAAKKRIEIGVSSIEREAAELTGADWEDVHEERVDETERRRADGLEQEGKTR